MTDLDDRVLDAALAVLAESGMSGLTLSRMAEEMGASRMTLHRNGISRQGIVERLSLLAVEEYRRAVWPALTAAGSGSERLELALRATCDVADRWRHLLTGLFAEDGGVFHEPGLAADRPEAEMALATRAVFIEPLARLLRDGAKDGSLAAFDDPDLMATVLFNQVGWTFLALRVGQRWPADASTNSVVGLAMRGVSASRDFGAEDEQSA
ncbi:MAG: TetR/AcrR family transcriptional regulator [Acidimicrobiales bacterium]|nr:TetR/AcrR family transcriptional regulator [Acidimicrobiales bacterium]